MKCIISLICVKFQHVEFLCGQRVLECSGVHVYVTAFSGEDAMFHMDSELSISRLFMYDIYV